MAEDKEKLLARIRERVNRGYSAQKENYDAALDDRKFRAGEQWPEAVKAAREEAGRPCLTLPKVGQYVRQVTGDIRLNKPSIDVKPAEDGDVATAEVYEGIIRSIEDQSEGLAVYVQAAEDAVTGGFGFFRVLTEYCDPDSFDQDARIRHIRNAHAVIFDPDMQDPTGRDAKWCVVYEEVPKEEFKRRYPNATDASAPLPDGNSDTSIDWFRRSDKVRICEYFEVQQDRSRLVLFEDGTILRDPDDDVLAAADAYGIAIKQERQINIPHVVWWKTNGADILEGPIDVIGDRVPILRVIGEEIRVGERSVIQGIVRPAKDSQRMENYWASASVERIALAPKAPWLVTGKMISDNEEEWINSGTGNPNVLIYTPDEQAPGLMPKRIDPAPVEAAMIQQRALAVQDMKEITGIYDAGLGNRSNETSGVAINARKQESDVGTSHYPDHLNRAIRECGRILIQMIPKLYDAKKQIRILGKDMQAKIVQVNQDGAPDLTAGKYDVTVSTGPSFTTRRDEARQVLTDFMQAYPPGAPFVVDLVARNMDFPGADELSERLKQMLQAQTQGQGPDPAVVTAGAKAKLDMAKLDLQATEAKSKLDLEAERIHAQAQLDEANTALAQQELRIRALEAHVKLAETMSRHEERQDRADLARLPQPEPKLDE